MGDIPGSFSRGPLSNAFIAAARALAALRWRLRGLWLACGPVGGLCGPRLLSDPFRGLPGQGDVRAGLREIDDLCERVAASLRRRTVVGFFARSRIRPRDQERVQAGACLGIEIAAHVPATGPLLA
ncbi:hypothetical protein AORI_7040 [Amycolatopsis keratiniphila]|uniref:Uncharacterized protein n=1 Tax=Amycolatopsis keratiniphila TaxID=129921 RepID=R4TFV1_9PSEU|nr:hypothetical protein AORI_7040 [Amycolatopsis keratiniphila]